MQNLLGLPGRVHAMLAGGVPWWQILYTGLMSTDAVLMIEVRGWLLHCRDLHEPLWTFKSHVLAGHLAGPDEEACALWWLQVVALHDVSSTGKAPSPCYGLAWIRGEHADNGQQPESAHRKRGCGAAQMRRSSTPWSRCWARG